MNGSVGRVIHLAFSLGMMRSPWRRNMTGEFSKLSLVLNSLWTVGGARRAAGNLVVYAKEESHGEKSLACYSARGCKE